MKSDIIEKEAHMLLALWLAEEQASGQGEMYVHLSARSGMRKGKGCCHFYLNQLLEQDNSPRLFCATF